MVQRRPYRRHSARFKLQICHDIRSGVRTRSATIKEFELSNALIQQWMVKFDAGTLDADGDDQAEANQARARLAALERKVGQLAMELESLRGNPSQAAPRTHGEPVSPDACPCENEPDP
jgi:transposase-like protein